ncbi:MAG: TonB-dependent receptor [Hyphomonas sp.]
MSVKSFLFMAVAAAPLIGFGGYAGAQSDDDADDSEVRRLDTVTVESRLREENIQDVPVVVQAFDSETLEAFAAQRFQDIADLTSGLTIYTDSTTNPSINLRGIQGNPVNARQDEPVSINLNGIPHSSSQVLRLTLFDLEAVEVLKGPQALYFGKNSPGGIIVMRTKNPTDELYTELQAGYEFEGQQSYGHGIVSGPFSENWGGRLAVRAAEQEGYYENIWGDGDPSATQPVDQNGPRFAEVMAIGTLQGEFDRGEITLKAVHGNRTGGQFALTQAVVCNSVQDENPFTDCTADERFSTEDFSAIGVFNPSTATRGEPKNSFNFTQVSLDGTYNLSENWDLQSITGWVDARNFHVGSIGARNATINGGLGSSNDVNISIMSQELRLRGEFDRFNVMFGGFADDRSTDGVGIAWVGPLPLSPDVFLDVSAESWSVFAQADYDITDTVNVSVGGRYTEEDLTQSGYIVGDAVNFLGGGVYTAGSPVLISPDSLSYTNFSPEVSVSWQPQDNLNFFVNYREGFKSGGFNSSAIELAPTALTGVPGDDSFNEELVEGFELGAKMDLFDRTVRLNTTLFSYDYTDLQQPLVFSTAGGGVETKTVNAGQASVEGFEADLYWVTPIEGLDVTANVAYNNNALADYISACNEFQKLLDPTGAGCDVDVDGNVATNAGGALSPGLVGTGFEGQDRTGDPLRRAPEWSGSAGFAYQTAFRDGILFNATGRAIYSGEYSSEGLNDPRGIQDAYTQWNASIGLAAENGGWELDLIGRNLTNEITFVSTFDNDPGAATRAPGEPPNLGAIVSTPMQIFLQLTVRPQALFN